MTYPGLTKFASAAKPFRMNGIAQEARRSRPGAWGARAMMPEVLWIGAVALAGLLSGCISVNAPDKPIVIELNINIKQEVIYRLAADAGNTIDSNRDIF